MHRSTSWTNLWRAAAIALALVFTAPVTVASAAVPTQPAKAKTTSAKKPLKAKFYVMSGSLFDGRRMAPATSLFSMDTRPVFGRLLTLRKPNFLKGTFESAKMSVFR